MILESNVSTTGWRKYSSNATDFKLVKSTP
jgi:hypothetical protein